MVFPSGSSFFGGTHSLLKFTEEFFAFLAQHSPIIHENFIPQKKGFFQDKNFHDPCLPALLGFLFILAQAKGRETSIMTLRRAF
jgi:hypothetical protein